MDTEMMFLVVVKNGDKTTFDSVVNALDDHEVESNVYEISKENIQ